MAVHTQSRAEQALARSATYRLLSQALSYPTPEGVRQLIEEDVPLAEELASGLPSDVRTALGEVARSLRGVAPEDLEAAHRSAFSHVHSADCSAFEDDYIDGNLWLRSHQLADIAGFYRAFGVTHRSERPDHVAVELEFLHLVSCKLAQALASGETEHVEVCARAEDRFLRDHALRWMPGFARRLARVSPAGPYRSIAALLAALVRAESDRIGVRPGWGAVPEPELEPEGMCEEEG
jgi:DMSO reductase family type II enzyme chaperone